MDSDSEQLQREIIIERNPQVDDDVKANDIISVPLVLDNDSQDALNHNLDNEQLNIVNMDKNQNPSNEELNIHNQEKETLIQNLEVVSADKIPDKENKETTEMKIEKDDPDTFNEAEKSKIEPSTSKSNCPIEVKKIRFY